jgi:hypothetical protein
VLFSLETDIQVWRRYEVILIYWRLLFKNLLIYSVNFLELYIIHWHFLNNFVRILHALLT